MEYPPTMSAEIEGTLRKMRRDVASVAQLARWTELNEKCIGLAPGDPEAFIAFLKRAEAPDWPCIIAGLRLGLAMACKTALDQKNAAAAESN